MTGGADLLHATFGRLMVGTRADKGGQEAVVNVDDESNVEKSSLVNAVAPLLLFSLFTK